jgi:hypothetical protein
MQLLRFFYMWVVWIIFWPVRRLEIFLGLRVDLPADADDGSAVDGDKENCDDHDGCSLHRCDELGLPERWQKVGINFFLLYEDQWYRSP